jgi:hypothetical protein
MSETLDEEVDYGVVDHPWNQDQLLKNVGWII